MFKFKKQTALKPSKPTSWPAACGERWCLNGPPGDECTTFWLCVPCSKACNAGQSTTHNSTHFSAVLQLKTVAPAVRRGDDGAQ
jgi:hypothetical protein